MPRNALGWVLPATLALVMGTGWLPLRGQGLSQEAFRTPARQYRPWTVWWWFGNATPASELVHELEEMDRQGIGGVEINPVYMLDGADARHGIVPVKLYSSEWQVKFNAVAAVAERLGMKVVLRGGSGWPYGGPWITPQESAAAIAPGMATMSGPRQLDVSAPAPKPYSDWKAERLEAAAAWNRSSGETRALGVRDGRIRGTLPPGEWQITAAWLMRTGQTVKRNAPGGGGLVLDHFRAQSLDLQLQPLGEALELARRAGPHAIAGVSSDSLELDDSNWTPSLLEEFERRKGYRLEQYLPHLWNNIDARTSGVRQDYLEVLGRLQVEGYMSHLTAWCERRGLKSYVQAHGGLSDALEAYGAASVPEGETIWPGTEQLTVNVRNRRIAASAADLYGKPVSMAESYTWLRMPRFLVRLDQMKAASDAIFLDGIRHIKNHGFPSSPRELGKPGWVFYASTLINPNQTWWPHYHALSSYVTRMNYLMQAGERVSNVAIYGGVADARAHCDEPPAKWLGEDDAWHEPGVHPGLDTTARIAQRVNTLAQTLYRRGYGFDVVSDDAIETRLNVNGGRLGGGTRSYGAVVLVHPESVPVAVMRKLAALVKTGGRVIAVGSLPGRGVGLNGGQQADEVAELAKGFQLVHDEDQAERALREAGWRDFTAAERDAAEAAQATVPLIGETAYRAVHRKAGDVDYYFVANGDRVARELEVGFRDAHGRAAQVWDPLTGEVRPWQGPKLALGPWGSAVIVFGLGAGTLSTDLAWSEPHAVNGEWRIRTEGTAAYEAVWTKLQDWRDVPELKSFAGLGIYSRDIAAPAAATQARICLGRVEQSAEVRVNTGAGGVTFLAPYCVDAPVRAGANRLEVRVANTWSNAVAAMPPQPSVAPGPGYGVTDVLYGNTARPPQPGGLLGPVTVQFR